jgi:hypothetical protein
MNTDVTWLVIENADDSSVAARLPLDSEMLADLPDVLESVCGVC